MIVKLKVPISKNIQKIKNVKAYNAAIKYFKDNNINYTTATLYKDILTHYKGNKEKATISYYLTYSDNFKL